ncbi:hypothetical protein, partial [Paenibacillus sp. N3.4]|uniref:hypothetical protein n=1 Tax=Paenibacillus sp. N3.4 TaxID=2603222 RepID=UPI001C9BC59B
ICVASEILQSLFERLLVRAYSLVVQFSKINFFRFNPSPLKGDLINIPQRPIRLQELFFVISQSFVRPPKRQGVI